MTCPGGWEDRKIWKDQPVAKPSGKEKVEGISQSTLFLFLLPVICFGSVLKCFYCKVLFLEREREGGVLNLHVMQNG